MFHLRRTALRLLSSPSSSFLSKPRSISTATFQALRLPKQSTSITFQRRWATGEAEAKAEDEEAPISTIQPTPEEEVANAIQSDNAGTETGTSSELAPESHTETAHSNQSTVDSAINAISEVTASAASTVGDVGRSATGYAPSHDHGSDSRGKGLTEPKATIYVGNLFFDVTENDLVKEMARFGTIVKCRLMRDARGLSKGFGYVDFQNIESATRAIENLNQQLFEGRRLSVQYAAFETRALDNRSQNPTRPHKPLNPPSKTLFIGNMSFEMTDRDLNNLFKGIKNVVDVRVAIDRRTGQPRGFAHADFMDVKSAMEGMKHLEGKETYGRVLRLDYSYGPSSAPRNQSGPE